MSKKDPVILHIPHDSTVIPDKYRDGFLLSDEELTREIITITDMHTDELYQLVGSHRVVFPICRVLLDPERFSDDAQESMAARGMGMIYEVTTDLKKLREPPSDALRAELKQTYYDPHHLKLEETTEAALKKHNKCLIIDCHSFPSKALPYENRSESDPRPEICIGTDSYHTPAGLYDTMHQAFSKKGYSIEKDVPFSGALTPMKYYDQDKRVQAIMIEVRRDLYMNEETGEKSDDFDIIADDLTDVMFDVTEYFIQTST